MMVLLNFSSMASSLLDETFGGISCFLKMYELYLEFYAKISNSLVALMLSGDAWSRVQKNQRGRGSSGNIVNYFKTSNH